MPPIACLRGGKFLALLALAAAVSAEDSIIRHYNGPSATGTPTLTYYRPVYWAGNVTNPPANSPANGTRLTQGYITIQAESHPYRFRKFDVLDLEGCMDRNSAAFRTYFVKSKPSACSAPTGSRYEPEPASPPSLTMDRTATGYSIRSARGGILEIASLSGSLLHRQVLTGPSRFDLGLRPSGLVLVKWRSGKEAWTIPVAGF